MSIPMLNTAARPADAIALRNVLSSEPPRMRTMRALPEHVDDQTSMPRIAPGCVHGHVRKSYASAVARHAGRDECAVGTLSGPGELRRLWSCDVYDVPSGAINALKHAAGEGEIASRGFAPSRYTWLSIQPEAIVTRRSRGWFQRRKGTDQ